MCGFCSQRFVASRAAKTEEVEVSTNGVTAPSNGHSPANMMQFEELSDIIRCGVERYDVSPRMLYRLRMHTKVHYSDSRHVRAHQIGLKEVSTQRQSWRCKYRSDIAGGVTPREWRCLSEWLRENFFSVLLLCICLLFGRSA